jgi:hypothetical protein
LPPRTQLQAIVSHIRRGAEPCWSAQPYQLAARRG